MPSRNKCINNSQKTTSMTRKKDIKTDQIPLIEYGDLMTLEETSAYLRISPHTLYKWVEAKLIPFYRTGERKLLFNKRKLSVWLEEREEY